MSFIDAPRLASIAPFSPAEERRSCPLHASRRTPDGDHAVIGEGSPEPAVRPTGGFQVTRRQSGTRSARVSWTRHSAERGSPRHAPTVGGWESCGRRGRGAQETTPRTSYRQRLFVEHDLGESSGSTVDVALSWVSMA